jgi:hypothetical protein
VGGSFMNNHDLKDLGQKKISHRTN